MDWGSLFKTSEFRRFMVFLSAVTVGGLSPVVYKIYTEIKNIPGKSFFLYRRKCLESDPNETQDPFNPEHYLDERKNSKYTMMIKDLNLEMSKMLLPAFVGCVAGFSLYRFYFLRRIKSSQPGKVLVIYRKFEGPKQGDNDIIRTLYTIPDNKPFPVGKFIYPWQHVGYVTEEKVNLKLEDFKVFSKDGKEIQITLDLIVGVSEKDVTLSLYRASAYLIDLTAEQIKERALESVQGGLINNIKDYTYSDIAGNIVDFNYYITQIVTWYLKYLGLIVHKASLVHIKTPDGDIDIPITHLK
ncbi:hypothetical protein C9374_007370 [Naegleria lovaniensis]|uniref:Band 7 domain-containing protein n=1 Tax=Naegleria lovaniensis TaxID=51637 RepID=A0AA88GLA4_NAELO|nr:uncharacterized protein C9374_007370 [Naegleria lovaniensis]KAG2379231.1 hypothetical protein C9374_007370 [Naegleria lovaniensis]